MIAFLVFGDRVICFVKLLVVHVLFWYTWGWLIEFAAAITSQPVMINVSSDIILAGVNQGGQRSSKDLLTSLHQFTNMRSQCGKSYYLFCYIFNQPFSHLVTFLIFVNRSGDVRSLINL